MGISGFRDRIKWFLCWRELEELAQWRNTCTQYERWLSEFPQISTTLWNMRAEVNGESLNIGHPPGQQGPWDVSGLREILRRSLLN